VEFLASIFLMRRSKSYSYSSSRKPSHWLRNGLLALFIGLPLTLVLAEFVARSIVQSTGADQQLSSTQDVSIEQAYRLQLRDSNGKAYPNLPESGQLQIRRSAFLDYELLPDRNNKFWQINQQGFRYGETLPQAKRDREVRIFVLGGSTAFGAMAANNQSTLAPKLEKLLNDRVKEQNDKPAKFKPPVLPEFADQVEAVNLLPPRIREGKYHVITAAVPGYNSSNELSLLAHRIMAYSPDCIVILDGYEDLKPPGYTAKQAGVGNIEQLLQNPSDHYRQNLSGQFEDWLGSFYLVKLSRRWILPSIAPAGNSNPQLFSADLIPSNDADLKGRVDRYKYNLRQIAKITTGIPTIIAIQPEITGKSKLTTAEAKLLEDLGSSYIDRVKTGFAQLEAQALTGKPNLELVGINPKLKVFSYYRLYENFDPQAFSDPIHLTDAGTDKLAQALSGAVQDMFSIEPKFSGN